MIRIRDGAAALTGVTSIRIRDGAGNLVAVNTIRMRDGSATLVTAFSALAASASPTTVVGYGYSNSSVTVRTEAVTASPVGGAGPFTYAWAFINGDTGWAITAPTSARTSFEVSLTGGGASYATFRCTITDFNGNVAPANLVNAIAENSGDLS